MAESDRAGRHWYVSQLEVVRPLSKRALRAALLDGPHPAHRKALWLASCPGAIAELPRSFLDTVPDPRTVADARLAVHAVRERSGVKKARLQAVTVARVLEAASRSTMCARVRGESMAIVAAALMVFLDEPEAIAVLASMLRRAQQGDLLMVPDKASSVLFLAAMDDMLTRRAPAVVAHFARMGLHTSSVVADWASWLFCRSFGFGVVLRMIDAVLYQGFDAVMRVCVGVVLQHARRFLACTTPAELLTCMDSVGDAEIVDAFMFSLESGRVSVSTDRMLAKNRLVQICLCVGFPGAASRYWAYKSVLPPDQKDKDAKTRQTAVGVPSRGGHPRDTVPTTGTAASPQGMATKSPRHDTGSRESKGDDTEGARTGLAGDTDSALRYSNGASYLKPPFALQNYNWIGFDLDHTLLSYKQADVDELMFRAALRHLIDDTKAYASVLSGKEPYCSALAMTGIVLDRQLGNLLKLDSMACVSVAFHGFRRLSAQEVVAAYDCAPLPGFPGSTERFSTLHTCFERPLGPLFATLVSKTDELVAAAPAARGGPAWRGSRISDGASGAAVPAANSGVPGVDRSAANYSTVADDLAAAFRFIYSAFAKDGFASILSDPSMFVRRQQHVRAWLARLSQQGVRLFALTNADFDHANSLMSHAYGEDWTTLFDVVVVNAKKRAFFSSPPKAATDGRSPAGLVRRTPGGARSPALGGAGGKSGGGSQSGLRPFLEINPATKEVDRKRRGCGGSTPQLRRGSVYTGGNLWGLMAFMEDELVVGSQRTACSRAGGSTVSDPEAGSDSGHASGADESKEDVKSHERSSAKCSSTQATAPGVRVCYFGDHILQDVVGVQKCGWDAVAVVPEVEHLAVEARAKVLPRQPLNILSIKSSVGDSDTKSSRSRSRPSRADPTKVRGWGNYFACGTEFLGEGRCCNANISWSYSARMVLESAVACIPSVAWLADLLPEAASRLTASAIGSAFSLAPDLRDLMPPVLMPVTFREFLVACVSPGHAPRQQVATGHTYTVAATVSDSEVPKRARRSRRASMTGRAALGVSEWDSSDGEEDGYHSGGDASDEAQKSGSNGLPSRASAARSKSSRIARDGLRNKFRRSRRGSVTTTANRRSVIMAAATKSGAVDGSSDASDVRDAGVYFPGRREELLDVVFNERGARERALTFGAGGVGTDGLALQPDKEGYWKWVCMARSVYASYRSDLGDAADDEGVVERHASSSSHRLKPARFEGESTLSASSDARARAGGVQSRGGRSAAAGGIPGAASSTGGIGGESMANSRAARAARIRGLQSPRGYSERKADT